MAYNALLVSDRLRASQTHLLDHTAAVHLEGQVEDVSLHCSGQNGPLDLSSVLKQFLDHLHRPLNQRLSQEHWGTYIVPEDVLRERQCVDRNDFVEDMLLLIDVGRLQLRLNETRAMLVPRKFYYMIINISQQPLALFVNAEFLQ